MSKLIQNKRIQKCLIFFENTSIKILILLYILFSVSTIILNNYFDTSFLYELVVTKFGYYLITNNSNLVTIATVLVGIYFTIYIFIMSAPESSVYQNLSPESKTTLVKILNWGFFTSFSFVLTSLFYEVIYNNYETTASYFMLGLTVLYLYAAFVFGTVIFFMIRIDIEKTYGK